MVAMEIYGGSDTVVVMVMTITVTTKMIVIVVIALMVTLMATLQWHAGKKYSLQW